MGITEGMKDIVENIVDARNRRAKDIGRVVADTKRILKDAGEMIQDFSKERKLNASEQAKKLADFASSLTKNVGDMIDGFRDDRKEMSEKQSKDLSAFIEKLEDDIQSMLEDFKESRKEMAEELREKLAKEVQDIKTHVKGLLEDADELIEGYRSDMKGARAAWQGLSSALAKGKKEVVTAKVEEKNPPVSPFEKGGLKGDFQAKKPFENRHFDEKIVKKATKKKKK